ncbi:hypothetical protein L0F63_003452 [Massospora cicadina]|nr:hypothetical protein L0F63_003452 [Massospora cicadina]
MEDELYTKLVRRIDAHIIPFVALASFASFLDRVNIGHARLYKLEEALKISSSQYAMSLSIFFVGYVLFEVPSNLIMKQTTPPKWIGTIMMAWGMATIGTAVVVNYPQLLVARALLGITEAGLADCHTDVRVHFLKLYQRPHRLHHTVDGWRLASELAMVKWLSQAESRILTCHLAESHVEFHSASFDKEQFIHAFTDYKTYAYMLLYFSFMCPMYSFTMLMPTIVKGLGFNVGTTMLLTAPPYLLAILFNLALAWNSDRTMNRCFHIMASASVAALGFLSLVLIKSTALRYIALCLISCGVTSATAPTLSWVNNNLIGSTRAATASALIIMLGNCGGIVAGQFYSSDEAPNHTRSHTINFLLLCGTLVLSLTMRWLLIRENYILSRKGSPSQSSKNTPEFRYIY